MRSSDAVAVVLATKSFSIRTRPPDEATARKHVDFYSIPASQQFRVVALKLGKAKAEEAAQP
jgi:hypothetical protein